MTTEFTSPHQFEPLLVAGEKLQPMVEQVVERSDGLRNAAHPATRERLRELLRAMNSYYSNRIEGQGTHPANIERALRDDFSSKPGVARLQRIAKAYLVAERAMEALVVEGQEPLTAAFAQRAHEAMYSLLSREDRRTQDGSVIEPGALRVRRVTVGRHEPPAPDHLDPFLRRYDAVYPLARERMIAVA